MSGLTPEILLDRIPPLIHGLVLALPESVASPQELFEISWTVLQRWGKIWWDDTAEPGRGALWKLVAEVVSQEKVGTVFRHTGVPVEVCAAS